MRQMIRVARFAAVAAVLVTAMAGSQLPAIAGGEEFNLGNRPWDFTPQNRAGIAALIEQQKNGTLGGTGTGNGGGCGGNAGNSTATGNYTCIIINESQAAIEILQDENGGQTANTQTQTSGGNLSDALQDLNN
jgi:hypothetical protein